MAPNRAQVVSRTFLNVGGTTLFGGFLVENAGPRMDCSCRATADTLRCRPWKPSSLKQETGRNRRHWHLKLKKNEPKPCLNHETSKTYHQNGQQRAKWQPKCTPESIFGQGLEKYCSRGSPSWYFWFRFGSNFLSFSIKYRKNGIP